MGIRGNLPLQIRVIRNRFEGDAQIVLGPGEAWGPHRRKFKQPHAHQKPFQESDGLINLVVAEHEHECTSPEYFDSLWSRRPAA